MTPGTADCPVGAVADHLSVQCAGVAASAACHDTVLAPLGDVPVMEFGGAVGCGVLPKPDFFIGPQATGDGFCVSHVGFAAPDWAAVQAFYDATVQAGVDVLHRP